MHRTRKSTTAHDAEASHIAEEDVPRGEEDRSHSEASDESESPDDTAEYGDSESHASQAAANDGEEESIEEYMARLLNRMRGGTGAKATSEPAAKVIAPSNAAQTSKVATGTEVVKKTPKPVPVEVPAPPVQSEVQPVAAAEPAPVGRMTELGPRSSRPETVDLVAMRELANSQARAAIHTHRHSTTRRNAFAKWSMSAGAGRDAGGLVLDAAG